MLLDHKATQECKICHMDIADKAFHQCDVDDLPVEDFKMCMGCFSSIYEFENGVWFLHDYSIHKQEYNTDDGHIVFFVFFWTKFTFEYEYDKHFGERASWVYSGPPVWRELEFGPVPETWPKTWEKCVAELRL